jgi:hypothetical protein
MYEAIAPDPQGHPVRVVAVQIVQVDALRPPALGVEREEGEQRNGEGG